MPFIDDVAGLIQSLPEESTDRLILEFLRDHGQGRTLAQPWSRIRDHLADHGIEISQQTFQQGLLKTTREGTVFIGANDHGAARGYFLIVDRDDADLMRQWYVRRIETEQNRLRRLEDLIGAHDWP
jgi:hypothetical protein